MSLLSAAGLSTPRLRRYRKNVLNFEVNLSAQGLLDVNGFSILVQTQTQVEQTQL